MCVHTQVWTGPTKGGLLIFLLRVSILPIAFTRTCYWTSFLMFVQEAPEQGPTWFPPFEQQIMKKILPYSHSPVQVVVGFAWHRGTACGK